MNLKNKIMFQFNSIAEAKKICGVSYIGKINNSVKHEKAYKYNELVYTIYLAPANISGYEVCPGRSKECTDLCLNGSGNALMYPNMINGCRIKKTKLLFENRQFITQWIIREIKKGINRANKKGFKFSVRLNNTSDISPENFYIYKNGKKINLLEYFPDIIFYDYTKVPERIKLLKKYPNYDLTFSYNGFNLKTCKKMLENDIRVAMVFKKVPEKYLNYNVIDGDQYDMRYRDPKNVIVGLKYKHVKIKNIKQSKFVI